MQALLEEMGSDSNISKVKRLAGKAWDAARKAGDNAYKAISEFFQILLSFLKIWEQKSANLWGIF